MFCLYSESIIQILKSFMLEKSNKIRILSHSLSRKESPWRLLSDITLYKLALFLAPRSGCMATISYNTEGPVAVPSLDPVSDNHLI